MLALVGLVLLVTYSIPMGFGLAKRHGVFISSATLAQVEYTFNLNLVQFIFVVKVTFVYNII